MLVVQEINKEPPLVPQGITKELPTFSEFRAAAAAREAQAAAVATAAKGQAAPELQQESLASSPAPTAEAKAAAVATAAKSEAAPELQTAPDISPASTAEVKAVAPATNATSQAVPDLVNLGKFPTAELKAAAAVSETKGEAWVRRGLSNSRTRPRGPIFGPILASLPPGVGQNPDSCLPRRRQGRWEPGFGPTPGCKEAKFGSKMGPRSRVRLLLRPRRTRGEAAAAVLAPVMAALAPRADSIDKTKIDKAVCSSSHVFPRAPIGREPQRRIRWG
jgi:hypothetical protein